MTRVACRIGVCQSSENMQAEIGFEIMTPGLKACDATDFAICCSADRSVNKTYSTQCTFGSDVLTNPFPTSTTLQYGDDKLLKLSINESMIIVQS